MKIKTILISSIVPSEISEYSTNMPASVVIRQAPANTLSGVPVGIASDGSIVGADGPTTTPSVTPELILTTGNRPVFTDNMNMYGQVKLELVLAGSVIGTLIFLFLLWRRRGKNEKTIS